MKNFLVCALLAVSFQAVCQSVPADHQAIRGIIDARSWNFNDQKLALTGEWAFFQNNIIQPADSTQPKGEFYPFPKIWDPSVQYGTYQLMVLLPESSGMAIEFPQMYCSYECQVNGKKIAANGKVGTSKESTTPQWLPQVVSINNTTDSLLITLQISNFYHFKGGSKEPLYLGTTAMLNGQHTLGIQSSLIESIGLALLGIAFVLIYYLREERKKITFYFSLLCFSWALRSVFSNLYVFTSFFPDFDWNTMIRIEYLTLYLTMIWAILFLSRLFPAESSKTIKYVLVTANIGFIALTIIAPPLFFTQWLNVFLGVAAMLMVFSGWIVIRAWINERSGVRYILVCIFLSIALFAYDIFIFEGFFHAYNALFFSIGYLLMFILMGVSLLYHLRIFKGDGSSGMLTFDDLYGKER
ncbi:MAG: 7TM-DISM domain-containing protein [Cyclobacteriaceae bacterium]